MTLNKKVNGGPTFKVGDNVRTSRYKNLFEKGCIPNWPEEVFLIKKVIIIILLEQKLLRKRIAKQTNKQNKQNDLIFTLIIIRFVCKLYFFTIVWYK